MTIDKALRTHLETLFSPLKSAAAAQAFPAPSALSSRLEQLFPAIGVTMVAIKPTDAQLFATASVDMWLRAVHSFLVSAAVTDTSPLWASACGYYSSHYSIRALAHLLGCYQLFRRKRIVRLELQSGKHVCTFEKKNGSDREHRLYWKVVKGDKHFNSDPMFTLNIPDDDASDVGHRDRANYADHLGGYPTFRALDADNLRNRIQFISQIEFTAPPIPRRSKFPDVEAVQVIAYHRIVKFRRFVDEVLGASNRFWNVHRKPSWASDMIDFQLTEPSGLGSLTQK